MYMFVYLYMYQKSYIHMEITDWKNKNLTWNTYQRSKFLFHKNYNNYVTSVEKCRTIPLSTGKVWYKLVT